MLYLTLEETIENHRKMWRWIADETEKRKEKVRKREYFDRLGVPLYKEPFAKCYCCDYIVSANNKKDCLKCPLNWGGKFDGCVEIHRFDMGLFYKWSVSKNYLEATNLARQIAELPLKEEYQNES